MNGQRILYARVSSILQNLDRQTVNESEYDRVFKDKISGKDVNRPALQEMLAYARTGDTVDVHEISRLARNVQDLLNLVETMNGRGITVRFLKENLTFSPDVKSNPGQRFYLQILGAVSELERNMIRERQLEGIAIAKAAGKFKGGKRKLSAEQEEEIRQKRADGMSVIKLAEKYGVNRQTIYNVTNQSK